MENLNEANNNNNDVELNVDENNDTSTLDENETTDMFHNEYMLSRYRKEDLHMNINGYLELNW
jgi:hypothetical protein